MRKILSFVFLLLIFSVVKTHGAYVPLTVATGFTSDIVANGIGSALTTTTADMDGASYGLVSNGWKLTSTSTACTTGLPSTGIINSANITGLTFQLAAYTGNNDLRITTNNVAKNLTFSTSQAAQNLYLLAMSGTGTSTISVQVNFSDGTNQINTGILVSDLVSVGASTVAITGFQKIGYSSNNYVSSANGPNIYQYNIPVLAANQSKLITGVTITRTASGTSAVLNVLAVSISATPVATCIAPTSPTATSITSSSASLNWTATGTPINYQIKYGAAGFNVNTAGTSIFTTTQPYLLNPPLTPATAYSYYVRSICTVGDTSAWSPVVNFTTLCVPPTIVSKKDSFNCGTGSVTLEGTTVAGATLKWYSVATGGTSIGTGNVFVTPSLTTTTPFYVEAVQTASGCTSARQLVTATIRPIPIVHLGNDTTICPGVSYVFNAGNAGGSYLWQDGQSTQTITTNAAGQYSVKVTVNACIQRDTILITPGITPVNILMDSINLCDGSQTILNAGNAGSTYVWTPGGTTTQTITVTSGGTQSVQIKSVDGCKITSTTYVQMRPLPVANLGSDTVICASQSIVLDAGNVGYSFNWNTGANTQVIASTDSGTYKVIITSPYSCVMADSIHIAYIPSPKTEGFSFVPMFFDQLGKVSFSPLNPTNTDSYIWDFGDGSIPVTQTNPMHVYTASGFYDVTLTALNNCDSYAVHQTINVEIGGSTGVGNISLNASLINVFPNPAKAMINIKNLDSDVDMKEIFIYNAMGLQVYHSSVSNHQNDISIAATGFSNGLYMLKVFTSKGFVNKSIVIMH